MDKDFQVCGRQKEIEAIHKFITNHVSNNQPGILYLTGPPGTGKTMSINLILNKVNHVANLCLNCFKAQTAKVVLTKICQSLDITLPAKSTESSMMSSLAKKLTSRTSKPFILVLDEIDQLPKSNTTNFFSTIFSWTKNSFSKLIIVGIANTVNLTARCQAFASYVGAQEMAVEKIIFKPYSSKDIRAILNWYLENDENLEDASVDPKVVDLISKRIAREKGDIRTAIDNLRDTVYDCIAAEREKVKKEDTKFGDTYPTPPSTPPLSPRKDKTNLMSAANSVRKRLRDSHYFEDKAHPTSEVILVCLLKICSSSNDGGVDSKTFYGKAKDVLSKYGINVNQLDIRSVLEQLELQGTISFKKRSRMISDKIMLKASENEITRLSKNKESISDFVSKHL